jgi:hypothetical protein
MYALILYSSFESLYLCSSDWWIGFCWHTRAQATDIETVNKRRVKRNNRSDRVKIQWAQQGDCFTAGYQLGSYVSSPRTTSSPKSFSLHIPRKAAAADHSKTFRRRTITQPNKTSPQLSARSLCRLLGSSTHRIHRKHGELWPAFASLVSRKLMFAAAVTCSCYTGTSGVGR